MLWCKSMLTQVWVCWASAGSEVDPPPTAKVVPEDLVLGFRFPMATHPQKISTPTVRSTPHPCVGWRLKPWYAGLNFDGEFKPIFDEHQITQKCPKLGSEPGILAEQWELSILAAEFGFVCENGKSVCASKVFAFFEISSEVHIPTLS